MLRPLPAYRTDLANPIGLRLQVLEAGHLDTARNGAVAGTPTIQSIALGPAGQPIGYWLFPVHPGAWMLPGAGMASELVPAADVLHVYRKRRPASCATFRGWRPCCCDCATLVTTRRRC